MKYAEEIRRSFDEAYTAYSDAIFRFCFFKTSDRERAFDLTQETFVRLWNYLREDGRVVENTRALLYKIARNLIIDEYRKKDAFSLDSLRESGFDIRSDGHRDVEREIHVREALDALHKLDDLYREVAVLRFVEGLKPKEVADALSLSENVVSVRLNRAVKKLRIILDIDDEKQ